MVVAVNYSNFRKDLRSYMRQVNDDAEPLIVTSKEHDDVAVMGLRDYNALMETVRVASNPQLAAKITAGMKAAARGEVHQHQLIDVEIDGSDPDQE